MSKTPWRFVFLGLLCTAASLAQEGVTIRVNAAQTIGAFKPISQYFGYDEPNYTYTANGKKLIGELGNLAGNPKAKTAPPYIRAHFMLATGDGTPSLKWGSTNAYTEDAAGKPVYDWTIIDRIIDTYMKAGAKPFLEIGFMPQALSTHPEPYPAIWKPGAANTQYSVGWTYPPKDFAKWGALVHEWAKHEVAKYGRAEVATWYWEVWNEPDISYWHGTPEEYDQLYDFAVDGVRRALPEAKVGGPATTGPAGAKAAAYLKQFLEHCDSGKNAATGATGAPLDFITYHAKGSTSVFEGHVRMGVGKNTADAAHGMKIVAAFPKFKNLPIVISESDPEGCAACTARVYPQNAYRNGPQYAAYQAVMMKNLFELADREGTNIAGMLTWAFEFEGQPYFEGFRTLASNGLDKPILNLFRMTARMSGNRVMVESSGAIPVDAIQAAGVRANPDVDAIGPGDFGVDVELPRRRRAGTGGDDTAGDFRIARQCEEGYAASLSYRRWAQQCVVGVEGDGVAAGADGGAIQEAGSCGAIAGGDAGFFDHRGTGGEAGCEVAAGGTVAGAGELVILFEVCTTQPAGG
jgi:xylan 1,4-beta-xylosidase